MDVMYHKRKEKEKMIKLNRGKLVRKYIGEAMHPLDSNTKDIREIHGCLRENRKMWCRR